MGEKGSANSRKPGRPASASPKSWLQTGRLSPPITNGRTAVPTGSDPASTPRAPSPLSSSRPSASTPAPTTPTSALGESSRRKARPGGLSSSTQSSRSTACARASLHSGCGSERAEAHRIAIAAGTWRRERFGRHERAMRPIENGRSEGWSAREGEGVDEEERERERELRIERANAGRCKEHKEVKRARRRRRWAPLAHCRPASGATARGGGGDRDGGGGHRTTDGGPPRGISLTPVGAACPRPQPRW
eukprot:scaffold52886_cov27-Tisochrysis_lutea.AAC.1